MAKDVSGPHSGSGSDPVPPNQPGAGRGGSGLKLTGSEVMRKASELLHSTVEPTPGVYIADVLNALRGAINAGPAKEPPPKNLEEALGKINELVGKIDPPLENKPDFKAIIEAAKAEPPPKVEAVHAPDEPQAAKAS